MDSAADHLALANLVLVVALAAALAAWQRTRRLLRRADRRLRATEQRCQAELQLSREELERSRRARSTFLAAANHDLRQPMQALFCFSTILAQRVRGRSRTVTQHLQQSLQVLNSHIETLVDLSRLDAGIVKPEVAPVRMADLLSGLAAEYRPVAEEKGLRLRLVASRDWVLSDPALLRRVLGNLIDNAVRFTVAGGVVVGCRRRAGNVRIEVWDTGIGIPGEQIERVFEEFYQLGNPQRDRAHGLGLGLAVAERLVRMLPGHALKVRSRLGRGSMFAVELPPAEKRPVRHCAKLVHGPWRKPVSRAPAGEVTRA